MSINSIVNKSASLEIELIAISKTIKDIKKELFEGLEHETYNKYIITFDKPLRKFKLYRVRNTEYRSINVYHDITFNDTEILLMDLIYFDHAISSLIEVKPSMKTTLLKMAIDLQIDIEEYSPFKKFIFDIYIGFNYSGHLNDRMNLDRIKNDLKKYYGFSEQRISQFIDMLKYDYNYQIVKSEVSDNTFFLEKKKEDN